MGLRRCRFVTKVGDKVVLSNGRAIVKCVGKKDNRESKL